MNRVAAALIFLGMLVCGSAGATPPLEDYGKLPAVEQMQLSPSGDLIAFVVADGDNRQVRVMKVGGAVLFAVNVGQLKLRSLTWLGDGHLLVLVSKTLGTYSTEVIDQRYEMDQATIIDAATGKPMNVFRGEKQVYHAVFGYFGYAAVGGRSYGYFGGLTLEGSGAPSAEFDSGAGYVTHGHSDLYRVDLDTGKAEKIANGNELMRKAWLVTPAGVLGPHSEYESKTGKWKLFADLGNSQVIAEAADPTGNIDLVGFGPREGTVLVEAPGEGGKGDWQYTEYPDTAGGAGAPLFSDIGVRDLLFDPSTNLLIGAISNDEDASPKLFDPALQARFDKVRRAFKGERVDFVSASSSFDREIVRTTGPGDSGTYFFVDLTTGNAQAIGWNYPTILQADVGEVRTLTYKAADGLDIEAILTLPPGRDAKNLPLVVIPHGGPQDRDYPGFDYWAQAFASRGYAVLQPNFRGSDGFGKAFRDAGFGQWGRKMQTDISDGVAELARQGIVDPKRACIVGGSYGGYAALAGVTVQQGLYRCAVSVGGISNLNEMLKWDDTEYGEQSLAMRYEHQFLGVTSDGDPALQALSPRHFAERADAPILLIYGEDDTVVDPLQSRAMAEALKAAHKPVEVLELMGEDHWLSRAATRTQMIKAAVDFVMRNDPPN